MQWTIKSVSGVLFGLMTILWAAPPTAAEWAPAEAPLMTAFGKKVTPSNALPDYPRPQLVRDQWMNLNGLWEYALEPVDFTAVQGLITADSMTTGKIPTEWAGQLLVPFAIDSPLSGVMHILRPQERLWYRRSVDIPADWRGKRILMHIDAADWETGVYVNGTRIGQHRGGYDPFSVDITEALVDGSNEVVVCCWDGTEQQCQPIGKQIMPENRQGFRYQPTGGIWQTVWLEPVSDYSIDRITMIPDVENSRFLMTVHPSRPGAQLIEVKVRDNKQQAAVRTGFAGQLLYIPIPDPKLWSPQSPFLYDVTVRLLREGAVVDQVESYVGMRSVAVKKADDGFMRVHLNGDPVFQVGPLDQGYWPDGILTPPSDEAIRYDLEYLKAIGCNMVRVHIKKHPARWYYWADKLGLLVWQDFVCMPKYGQTVDAAASAQWRTEAGSVMQALYNHPSVVQWIVFNEAWGQHDTVENTQWAMSQDPSRIVTAASGWTDYAVGNIYDQHDYSFYPNGIAPADVPGRAIVLGELGGHNLYVPGHTWYENKEPANNFDLVREGGRATFKDGAAWRGPYEFFWENIRCLNAGAGLNAVVYTQITDVEHECNGWLTYDRAVSKIDAESLNEIHQNLYHPPILKDVLTDAAWKCTQTASVKRQGNRQNPDLSDPWSASGFDEANWQSVHLPMSGIASAAKDPFVMVLRKRLDCDLTGRKLAFRVDVRSSDTGRQPQENRRGFQPRMDTSFSVQIFLNGRLLRKASFITLDGTSGIGFLPLSDEEVARFEQRGNVLAIAVQNTDKLDSLDIRLQEMIEND